MHPATKPSAESSWASTALVRRSYPTVVESREPMLPPHRLPATWVGNTWTWSGRVRIFSWMVRQNCRAARSASLREPAILLSGGALLVGDIARPDLLGSRKDAERAARQFCCTLQEQILTLPDLVEGPSGLCEACCHPPRSGYSRPSGWLTEGMTSWRITARPGARSEQIAVH